MIVVMDTNVVIQASDGSHPFSKIIDGWVDGKFLWAVSTDILFEYEEVMTRMLGALRWQKFVRFMDLIDAVDGSLVRIATFFQFLTIPYDRDDDKFADCAISVHADFVITSDRHFKPMAGAGYKPQPISPQDFIAKYL
jgi:putative PIN family toxin of toxin-antitoxin system